MASQTNHEEIYNEINALLFDVCHFLNVAVRSEQLTPNARNDAIELISRSKEKVAFLSKVQTDMRPNETETPNSIDDDFPYRELTPWELPRCSTKYAPLITNERTFIFGPRRTLFVALVDCYLLFYKTNKKNVGPTEWINVMDYTARTLENRTDFAFEITAPGQPRLEFMARSTKDVDQWVVAINYKKQPVRISNISEAIIESEISEYWEAQVPPDPEEEPEYHNHSIIIPNELNRANDSQNYPLRAEQIHEPIPPLPDRCPTKNVQLKNKKLYDFSDKVEPENDVFNSVSEAVGIQSTRRISNEQNTFLHSQKFQPGYNLHNFGLDNAQVYPEQSGEVQDTDVPFKTAGIRATNENKEIAGTVFKHTINKTNTQSSNYSASSSHSWRKLSVEIPVNENEISNTLPAKTKKPIVPVPLRNVPVPNIPNELNETNRIEEPKSVQEMAKFWSQKN